MQSRSLLELSIVTRTIAVLLSAACLSTSLAVAAEPESVSKYVSVLEDGDEQARIAAIDALGQMGPAAKEAVGALAKQLSDQSATVRAHAAYALREIGPDAAPAAVELAKAISDPDFHVRRMAIAALETIRPDPKVVIEALGKALEDADPSVRVAALHTLTEYSDAAIPVLSKALENPQTAYWAALALGELGPQAKAAVPALAAALKTEQATTRREILLALGHIGPQAASAVPAIIPLLEDKDQSVQNAAAFALGSMGPAAASAADALRRTMSPEDDSLEECVNCWALARIEPQNAAAREHAIKLLLETVKDKDPRVQSMAIRGLLDLKAPPEQVVPALAYVIENGEPQAVHDALGALSVLGEAAIHVLDEALVRPEARGRAATFIAYLGPKAKGTVPALATALDDNDPDVRRELLFALASMGPDAAGAAPQIEPLLADPNIANRAVAAYALGRIGPPAAPSLPDLQEGLTSEEPLVRVASAYALVHIAPGSAPIAKLSIPVLVQGLQNPAAAARRGAAEGLAAVGKPARAVAEAPLRAAASDPDESVRRAALEALEKMGAVIDSPVPRPPIERKRLE